MSMERTLKAESSKPLLDCIRNDDDPVFQQHKYYVDKFDTTGKNLTFRDLCSVHLLMFWFTYI